jgi:threonine aldolase
VKFVVDITTLAESFPKTQRVNIKTLYHPSSLVKRPHSKRLFCILKLLNPFMTIDLRSDTVTKPTPGMLEAMRHADIGDDVLGEDPSVKKLEQKAAAMLGMDAGVFCPSGTMTNQIGIRVLTEPYDEIICYQGAHIYKYEGGGLSGNSLVSVKLLSGDRGRLTTNEIAASINNSADPHYPPKSVVALENSVVREAGSFYSWQQIREISEFSRSRGLKMHLDGARFFNAITESGGASEDTGKYFDTVSICLSKGLGAPVGSVLLCKKELEHKVRRMRKVFGGGMRQAGYLAAAGSYALDNHIGRLKEDHKRAKDLWTAITGLSYIKTVMPADTNIVIFTLADGLTAQKFLGKLSEFDIKASMFSENRIRMVTHLDFNDAMLQKTTEILKKLSF